MFIVEVTKIDYRTGETQTWRDKKRYKTLRGAERAAMGWNSVTKPGGGNIATESHGRVVPE